MGLTDYEWAALALSLKVAGYATLWLLPIGIVLAWVLARTSFIGKGLIDSLVHLPLVLPPVVIGYLLLISMGRQGLLVSGSIRCLGSALASVGAVRCSRAW